MEHGVEKHGGVSDREHESIAIRPDRIIGIETEKSLPQAIDDRGQRHGRSGMSGVGLLHSVHGESPDRVDAELIDLLRSHGFSFAGRRILSLRPKARGPRPEGPRRTTLHSTMKYSKN